MFKQMSHQWRFMPMMMHSVLSLDGLSQGSQPWEEDEDDGGDL